MGVIGFLAILMKGICLILVFLVQLVSSLAGVKSSWKLISTVDKDTEVSYGDYALHCGDKANCRCQNRLIKSILGLRNRPTRRRSKRSTNDCCNCGLVI